jgi:predicted nuclease of predicted toxin-antitoxin system
MLRFLADMNISPQTVECLRQYGWEIARVSELLVPTASDREILAFARDENRVIITQDIDFSMLLAVEGHASPSVINIRTSTADPGFIADRLLLLLPDMEGNLSAGCAITVEDERFRVRKLPIN